MTRERKREMSNDREAGLLLRKRRGFIHFQSEEKEGIIDESAAYKFQSRIKQAVKLYCTARGNGVKPSRR